MTNPIARELATFARELPGLLLTPGNRGRFALVHGDNVADLFPTFDAALAVGYERFGPGPFLVMEVTDRPIPRRFTRDVVPCQL